MRVAVVSDIHGNWTALQAVAAKLRELAPDVVVHGGDLADSGSGGVEVVDWIRAEGWQGVLGNTDEMLARPDSLEAFAGGLPALGTMWAAVREMAEFSRAQLGAERVAWLSALPMIRRLDDVTVVHARPTDAWRVASDDEWMALESRVVVTGHVHRPAVRQVAGKVLANAGSVGMPYDGDPRASFVLLDDGEVTVRRVVYDVEREVRRLEASGMPHAAWIARTLRMATAGMP